MEENNFENGLNAIRVGNYHEAITHFTNALKMERSSSTHSNRAFCYVKTGNRTLAKQDFESAISITIENLNKSDKKNVDSYIIDIIVAKATIGQLEMEEGKFVDGEKTYSGLIALYSQLSDKSILRSDLQIANIFNNLAACQFSLNKIEECARNLGAAYVESNTDQLKKEIADFAILVGLGERLKQCVLVYSMIKDKRL